MRGGFEHLAVRAWFGVWPFSPCGGGVFVLAVTTPV